MLKKEMLIKAITRKIIILKDYIKNTNDIGLTDANKIIQSIIAHLLNELDGSKFTDLDNIKSNHPAIDLGDIQAGIGIQVSSSIDSEKINGTISKMLKYDLFKSYPKLKFFNTREKQRSYKIQAYDQEKIQFNQEIDIMDWNDLIKKISRQDDVEILKKVNNILIDNFETNEDSSEHVDDSDGIHMIFKDKDSFDKWNEDVSFSQKLPRISINVKTKKPNYLYVVKKYSECFTSQISDDKRVCAKANNKLSKSFLNNKAQEKYHFMLANYLEMEEAGFYQDFDIDINYHCEIQLSEFIYIQPTNFEVCQDPLYLYPSISHGFDVILKNIKKDRNSYYFDSGESLEKNRISFFSNKGGRLCFRLIDANSKVFLFEMDSESSQTLFEKHIYVEFRFGHLRGNLKFSLFINDKHIYSKDIQAKYNFKLSPQNNKIGANIFGLYNGGLVLKKHSVDILRTVPYRGTNKKLLEIINLHYMDHEIDEEIYVTKDNKLVSWGSLRKQKKIIDLNNSQS